MDEPIEEEIQEQPVAFDPNLLSPCVLRLLARATDEARSRGLSFVGTDQLFMGLVSTPEGAAQRALETIGLSFERLAERLQFIRGELPPAAPPNGEPNLSPRLLRVLAHATKDATKKGHTEVGTLHILSGMLREKTGFVVVLLESPGVGLERAGGAISTAHREGWRDL